MTEVATTSVSLSLLPQNQMSSSADSSTSFIFGCNQSLSPLPPTPSSSLHPITIEPTSGPDGRRLTRLRKIRYATDDELGLRFPDDAPSSSPASPECARMSRYPDASDHWSSSAVPKPLPRPDLAVHGRLKSSGSSCGHAGSTSGGSDSSGRKHMNHASNVSTKTTNVISARGFSEPKHEESVNNGQRPSSILRSSFSSPPVSPRKSNSQHNFPPNGTIATMPSLFDRRKGLSHDPNFESFTRNLRMEVPARSAPTSVFSSPSVSPNKRPNSADVFPSSLSGAQEFHGLTALDLPSVGRPALCSPTASPVTVHTLDQSTQHSPSVQSPRSNVRSPDEFAFSSHHRLHSENSKDWPLISTLVNAHPLPLPPKASPPSRSLTPPRSVAAIQIPEKTTVSKSKWLKGRLIGRGTYGSVYMATHVETGATCAMKEVDIIPDDPKSAECIKQLEKEIQILRQLEHQNIVQYYGSEIVDDHFYIYLEYVHPGSINKYIREHCEAMTESIVRNFTRHILSGLAYLHRKKTIHRDIKGANLLVDAKGIVKLADFGMAKHLSGLNYELSLKGSPYWMAPEVIKAVMQKDANPDLALAVDIWSLGCTIIEMLTGRPPWSDLEGPQAMFKVLNRSPPIPETLSAGGKDFLQCCFRRNPAERPSALVLLDHPFVQCSASRSVSAILPALPRVHQMDKSHSLRAIHTNNHDLVFASSSTRTTNGLSLYNSESRHQPRADNCCVASQRPTFSNLELTTWPRIRQMIKSSHSFGPSSISRTAHLAAGIDHLSSPIRTRGREVRHI